MCIIASVPRGTTIDKPTLETMWQHNSDGAGISWIDDGKIQVYKTMKLKPFIKKFNEVVKQYGDSDILVHMRIATHGSVCMDNNHPFYVDTQTVFAHNGILPQQFHPPAKRDISDTRYFNETFLQYQKLAALDDSRYIDHLGSVIGSFNKLVILSANPKLSRDSYIINEASGEWADGIWYSNDSYLSYSRKMKWGTQSYQNSVRSTGVNTSKSTDIGANCTIGNTTDSFDEFDVETMAQWGLAPGDAWKDVEVRELTFELMTVYGYDTPQDMMEDFCWQVRKHGEQYRIECQFCHATLDINQYWPDCKVTCKNHVEYGDFHFPVDVEDQEISEEELILKDSENEEDWYIEDVDAKMEVEKIEQRQLPFSEEER